MDKHEKIFRKMKQTRDGWGESDFRTLYAGYGFIVKDGTNHIKISHPDYPGDLTLRTTVARHRHLARGYADTAVKQIERLLDLKGENQD